MTTETTYTVLNRHGTVQVGGVPLAEAARTVLCYDGHEFDIRPAADGAGYELWTSRFSRASTCYDGLTRSRIYSVADNEAEAEAEAEIFAKVIRNAEWFNGCTVMTDAEYDAMLAELAAEEAE